MISSAYIVKCRGHVVLVLFFLKMRDN